MKFVITINCDNAAFRGEDCGTEIARILRPIPDNVEFESADDLEALYGDRPKSLFDIEGKHVGDITFEND
jgi:hypothetical protein